MVGTITCFELFQPLQPFLKFRLEPDHCLLGGHHCGPSFLETSGGSGAISFAIFDLLGRVWEN